MTARRTSAEAYRILVDEGVLPRCRAEVYGALYRTGPATSQAIWRSLGRSHPSYVRARLSELREMGLVVEVGETECAETGMTVILWDVTDLAAPLPVARPPSSLERARAYRALLFDVASWLDARLPLAATRIRARVEEIDRGDVAPKVES